ncbi:sortase [Helicobacter pylori]|nr:sortase [Helicobacter pylori]
MTIYFRRISLSGSRIRSQKRIDALDADCEADEFIKKAENLKEEAKRKADNAQSSRNQLERLRITIGTKDTDMQDLRKQISDVRNLLNQLNTNGIDGDSALGVIAGCGGLGTSSFTAGAIMGGGLAASGLAGMAVFGGLIAGPALAILGAVRADDMEEKLGDAKAYYSQVEVAVKKVDVMIDDLRSVEKMAKLFTRQITKFDALFFSLSQDAIATMKKHNYDVLHYNQKENDQIATTYSTLMTLSAFLKVPIMDEHQKLNEKAKNALILMRDQMDSLKNGNYSLDGIGFRQAQLEDLRDDKTS